MMQIYFYQAECGDAARIRFVGNDGLPHNIFIDAGYESTYYHVLEEEIHKLHEDKEEISLWVISHIHDDHIGGVISYVQSILYGDQIDFVKDWFYNNPRSFTLKLSSLPSLSISEAVSIGQGDELTNFLFKIGKLPDVDITTDLPLQDYYGLKINILSPTPSSLSTLRQKYSVSRLKALEGSEISSISDAKSAKKFDYNIAIDDFDITRWREDNSVENASSISLLTEYDGKKVLWLADSHPTDIVKSLQNLGYSHLNPVVCDYVKVSHHGSKGNNSNSLYEMIRCNNYIMSVDGENNHCLPNKECIAQILRSYNRPIGSEYKFYFTYDNRTLRSIFDIDGEDVYKKWNFHVYYLKNQKYIEIK